MCNYDPYSTHSNKYIHRHFFPFPLSKLRFHDSNESQAFGFSGDVFCGDEDFDALNDFEGEVVTPVIYFYISPVSTTWETGGGSPVRSTDFAYMFGALVAGSRYVECGAAMRSICVLLSGGLYLGGSSRSCSVVDALF